MNMQNSMNSVLERLRSADLRPTRQRLSLAYLLFEDGHRHISAEQLYSEAVEKNISVSLATIYNTLHQFTDVGLLREIVVEAGCSYFDTNTSEHYHYFFEDSNRLEDVPMGQIVLARLPDAPYGHSIRSIDVVVRVDG